MAGADLVATNTFSSTTIAQADYGMESLVPEMNRVAAKLCRAACDQAETAEDGRRRFVVGALGPTNRTASISPDVNNPGFRAVTFDELHDSLCRGDPRPRRRRSRSRHHRDDLRHAECQSRLCRRRDGVPRSRLRPADHDLGHNHRPFSGRTLSGQTPTAFWHSMQHARPLSVGLNCALGAREMRAHLGRAVARRRHTHLCLPQRRPAQ